MTVETKYLKKTEKYNTTNAEHIVNEILFNKKVKTGPIWIRKGEWIKKGAQMDFDWILGKRLTQFSQDKYEPSTR